MPINLWRIEENLSAAHLRLAGTYVPWRECVKRYDRAHTFFYMDPPYWKTKRYGVDFDFQNYLDMAELMRTTKGKVMVSINHHPDMKHIAAPGIGTEQRQQHPQNALQGRRDEVRSRSHVLLERPEPDIDRIPVASAGIVVVAPTPLILIPSIHHDDVDVALIIRWPMQLEKRDDPVLRTHADLSCWTALVLFWLPQVTCQPGAELALLCLNRSPLKFSGQDWPNSRVWKSCPEQCHAEANCTGVLKVRVGDQLTSADPLEQFFS